MSRYPGKASILTLGWVAVTLMTAFPNAGTGDSAVVRTVPDSIAIRNESMADLRAELDTLGMKIRQLQARIEKAGSKAKRESRDDLDRLERAKDRIASRLDSLGHASSGAWRNIKARTRDGIDSLKADIDRLRDKAGD
jgi:chromosome segregation ATPase